MNSPTSKPITEILPESGWPSLGLRELWQYRDMLKLLVWRDFSSRYRQSFIGVGWALIRPIVSVVVFTIVFGKMVGVPSDDVPYPIFNFTGMLPWLFFAGVLATSSQSMTSGAALISKVYFPRLILPLSKIAGGLIDLAIQFALLAFMMFYFGVSPTPKLLAIPLFLIMAIMAALALGLLLTTVSVKYRDVHHVVPFLIQTWMWMTPVVYPSSMVDEKWRYLYGLNPLVGVVDGFRWSVLGSVDPDWRMMLISLVTTVVLMVFSLYYFRRTESKFADII
ncbi:ABC transporter permease [Roseimaritima ulvae]|uniref:Transport permease protein n=1 Tax=Roseimaritima ulvae TaxID=980254 RepID=A0A5B9QMC0_9BACT|nr:ABC transporter permease [Roseimaritima ulvae]QEG38645.1 Teichoic acid translocation permease protein TagG [Roseimaritima ulvae]